MKTISFSSSQFLFFLLLCFFSTTLASIALPPTSIAAEAPGSHLSPRQMAHAALAASAVEARNASAYFSRSSKSVKSGGTGETASFKDCAFAMADSASRLQKAVGEWSRLGPTGTRGFVLCINNIKTWVSAALTDQESCMASLDGSGEMVRGKVAVARKATSRALSLVNRIG